MTQDTIRFHAERAVLTNPRIPFSVRVAVVPAVPAEIVSPDEWWRLNAVPRADELRGRIPGGCRSEQRAAYRFEFDTRTGTQPIRILACKEDASATLDITGFDEIVQETKAFFSSVMEPYEIKTPDPVLDAAFYGGVMNLEYAWQPPAWYEGIHEWNGYFSDNYQISAAIALGQLDRSREALLFFGTHPNGPGGVYAAGGELDSYNISVDGMPYYTLQLYRYWKATADVETLGRVWPATCRNLQRLLEERDPNDDDLLNWHAGCNVFLYQADHLNLPGSSASPTLMMAGMLDRMAELADALGDSALAARWCEKAKHMRRECVRHLWLEDEGRFASGKDDQGMVQRAAYYTDYTYPILYSNLSGDYARRSLDALGRDLSIGDHLLRTGNYRPDFFGNNAVHPTAMTEGAEALLAAGCANRGWSLLHGTALSATILTDSPGAFPEYCTTTGWGLADWIFGNPAGAYVQAVAAGLFGFERGRTPNPLNWHPCLPVDWEHAELRLPGVRLCIEGRGTERIYRIELSEANAVAARFPLFGGELQSMTTNDGTSIRASEQGGYAVVLLPVAREHSVRMRIHRCETILPLDLTPLFNADSFPSVNHGIACRFAMKDDADSADFLAVGPFRFAVRPSGRNIVKMELGYYDRAVATIEPTDSPRSIKLPVGRRVSRAEFLFGADGRPRLTGLPIGRIRLHYESGAAQSDELVYGGNVDCSVLPFADRVVRRTLTHDPVTNFPVSVAAFSISADPARLLESVEIAVEVADITIGVLAANVVVKEEVHR